MNAEAVRLWGDFWSGRRRAERVDDVAPGLRRIELGPLEEPGNVLSPRESEVARAAACGLSNVGAGALLGLAGSTVSTYLAHALAKMGLSSPAELRFLLPSALVPASARRALRGGIPCPAGATARGRRLTFPLPRAEVPACLSPGERDVLRLALEGLSNAAIAAERGSSPRTVANQLSTIFGKLGVGSRRELDPGLLPALRRTGARRTRAFALGGG